MFELRYASQNGKILAFHRHETSQDEMSNGSWQNIHTGFPLVQSLQTKVYNLQYNQK